MFGLGKKPELADSVKFGDEEREFLEDLANDIRNAIDEFEVFNYDATTLQNCVAGTEGYPEPAVVLEYPTKIVRIRFEIEEIEL